MVVLGMGVLCMALHDGSRQRASNSPPAHCHLAGACKGRFTLMRGLCTCMACGESVPCTSWAEASVMHASQAPLQAARYATQVYMHLITRGPAAEMAAPGSTTPMHAQRKM